MIKITKNLTILREKIDSIDKEIVQLLMARIEIVEEVGKIKKYTQGRIYVPERENEIFYKLSQKTQILPLEIKNIYTEIISFCRKFENILDIGVFDEKNSLLALKNILGSYTNPIFCDTIKNLENYNYIILPLSKNLLEILDKDEYKIINFSEINGELFFLISREKNTLPMNNFFSYYISEKLIENNFTKSIKIENKKYFIIVENNILTDTNATIKFIGNSPKI